jgi:hypothetical protein
MHLQIIQDVSQLQEAPKAKGIVVALTLLPGKEATVRYTARAARCSEAVYRSACVA